MSDDTYNDDNVIVLPGMGGANNEGSAEGLEAATPVGPPAEHLMEAVVEALLLASDRPLTLSELDTVLCHPGDASVHDALSSIQERLRRGAGGIRLVEVSKGWQLRTDPRAAPWVAVLRGGKPSRLSRAALETLTVVAYRQPVTRAEIEDLRGVDPGGVLRMLVDRGLVTHAGRKDDPGRPLLYGTTPHFLEVFGLRDLSELPTLRDLRELAEDDARAGTPWPSSAQDGSADDDGEMAADEDTEPPPPLRGPPVLRPVDPR